MEEQQRLAAEQRAAREKRQQPSGRRCSRASTRRRRRSTGTSWPNSRRGSKCIGEAYGYDAAADPTVALAVNFARLDAVSQLTKYFEALKNEIKKDGFNLSIGMRYVVLDAHKSFSELLRNGNDEQIEEVLSELSLDGDVDSIYQGASMGLMTFEADRRAAREFEA